MEREREREKHISFVHCLPWSPRRRGRLENQSKKREEKRSCSTKETTTTTMMMMREKIVCFVAVGALLCASSTLFVGAEETVLTKDECKERVPYEDFATDNRIISCVRNASAPCCEAMQELLGDQSPVHLCTCSNGVLEDVLDEAVPLFAKEIIHQRIEECELPIAGDEKCDGLYDDAVAAASGDCTDEYPPEVDTQYTCADQAGFGKCEESWMQGFCLLSCEKCEASASEDGDGEETVGNVQEELEEDEEQVPLIEADEGEVLENGTLVLSNCTDVYPPDVDTRHSCGAQAGFGKFILPTTRTVASAASVSEGEVNGEVSPSTMNSTETDMDTAEDSSNSDGDSACVDEYPPDVDTQYTCEDQAGFGKCDESWMEGYCLLSCEKCINTTSSTDSTSS